jgi:hemoglobin
MKYILITKVSMFIGLCLLLNLSACSTFDSIDVEDNSLYQRLGGLVAISVVVDDFLNSLKDNSVLNANPAMKDARKRSPLAYLKFQVTTLVCQEAGGPCRYTGKNMKQAHAYLNIDDKQWQSMMASFSIILEKHKVPATETQELIAIMEASKADVLTH